MPTVDRVSVLWSYLPSDIKGLISDGEMLIEHAKEIPHKVSDYAYLVFPFSKAYEGFLKKLFLDLSLIREDAYYGDDIRIGRILNPGYMKEHDNVFKPLFKIVVKNQTVADILWEIWRKGRNQVFHYFPHNFRRLSQEEALRIVDEIIHAMTVAVENCDI